MPGSWLLIILHVHVLYYSYLFIAAAYFGATELIGQYLTDLGVSDGWSLIILIFIQCVDMKALLRGRFKFVEGKV